MYRKHKHFIKYLLILLVFCSSLVFFNAGSHNNKIYAAYICQPNKAPCCQVPNLGVGNGAVGSCFQANGSRYYVVADNSDKNPNPEKGHCYTVRDTHAFGFAYYNADCSIPPFNVNSTTTPFQPLKADCKEAVLTKSNCAIVRYIFLFINALSALVGVVVIIMVIVGGIEYSASANDPQRVASARSKITNALIALLLFIFMYAFLQWVVPGGIF